MDFTSFFQDIHGDPPLPWQNRLAQQLVRDHDWPAVIDLPTGSGKTACIDIAVFHLAWCAKQKEPWKAARRIVFVVDRRVIVDAAADRAERIRDALNNPRTAATRAVSEALSRLGGDSPLVCQKLRGGMAREQSFTLNPAQPMVITSTIDQVGSRLLFRGYGLSPYAAPVHAGLLGHDTLILLDEAHLAGPFSATVAGIVREQMRAEHPLEPIRPVRLVQMSATGPSTEAPFRLNEADLSHPIIKERLTAPKPAKLIEASARPSERLKVLARETLQTLDQLRTHRPSPAVAVIVNRVRTARELFDVLRAESSKRDFDIELVIGRSRPIDRDIVSRSLTTRLGPESARVTFERPIVVVATQTIEVGADLDFQGMITECAALAALRQRFGRLDRFGRFGRAQATIIGGGEPKVDPVYGPALAATWNWLNAVATSHEGNPCVDFSVPALDLTLATADASSLAIPQPPVLQLTPAFVQLLCQTSPRPTQDPDVPALLHGLRASEADVQVVWRSDLPVRVSGENVVLDPEYDGTALELLAINPPTSLEGMSLPIGTVRAWLEGLEGEHDLVDLEGLATVRPDGKKTSDYRARQVWRQTADGWKRALPRELRPGDVIVVPVCYGGCDEYGFAPDSRAPVRDLSSAAREALRKSPVLVFTKWNSTGGARLGEASGEVAWNLISQAFQEGRSQPDELLEQIFGALDESSPASDPWLREDPLVHPITRELRPGETELLALVVTSRRPRRGDISDEDLSSSRTLPVSLAAHNAGVGLRARVLAQAVGFESARVSTIGVAGDLHDIGKADPRFQTLLRAGDRETLAGELLAKGLRRVGSVRGESSERHEAYSVAFLRAYPQLLEGSTDPELAMYLVGTHHGRGRALMPDRLDDGSAFSVEIGEKTYEFNGVPELGAVGSGWPSLFWRLNRRYGPWGLAYLESLLRLADQLRSAEELEGKTQP